MARDYAAEYRRRQERAIAAGFTGYGQMRRQPKYGPVGATTPGARPHARRRIHDAVAVGQDIEEDWQEAAFGSSRVDRARYSPSRRELHVFWTNAPPGQPYPPYIYDAVDPATWDGFRSAGSAGRFINHTLNSFPYRPAPEIIGQF
jgi:hypothetical protein